MNAANKFFTLGILMVLLVGMLTNSVLAVAYSWTTKGAAITGTPDSTSCLSVSPLLGGAFGFVKNNQVIVQPLVNNQQQNQFVINPLNINWVIQNAVIQIVGIRLYVAWIETNPSDSTDSKAYVEVYVQDNNNDWGSEVAPLDIDFSTAGLEIASGSDLTMEAELTDISTAAIKVALTTQNTGHTYSGATVISIVYSISTPVLQQGTIVEVSTNNADSTDYTLPLHLYTTADGPQISFLQRSGNDHSLRTAATDGSGSTALASTVDPNMPTDAGSYGSPYVLLYVTASGNIRLLVKNGDTDATICHETVGTTTDYYTPHCGVAAFVNDGENTAHALLFDKTGDDAGYLKDIKLDLDTCAVSAATTVSSAALSSPRLVDAITPSSGSNVNKVVYSTASVEEADYGPAGGGAVPEFSAGALLITILLSSMFGLALLRKKK